MLEPEAAALSCQDEILKIEATQGDMAKNITLCYLVVDCGGGTIDMAAHKLTKTSDGKISIEEIHQAHGGSFGGYTVNDEFENLLKGLFEFSSEELMELKTKHSRQWVRFVYENFEYSKYSNTEDEVTIVMPKVLVKYVQEKTNKSMEELADKYKRHKVNWYDDEESLVLPFSTLNALYTSVICQITEAVDQVLKKPECQVIEQILLVGGFAESNLLFHEIERCFSSLKVKRSAAPSISVLQGAVLFGLHQNMITCRKMRQSIGIETLDDFVPGFHDIAKKDVIDGKEVCKNVFSVFAKVNQSVRVETAIPKRFPPASKAQDTCVIKIFGSKNSKTLYTDENECKSMGTLTVSNLPKFESGISREILVLFNVSGTEITVSAFCNGNGMTYKTLAKLDFIED